MLSDTNPRREKKPKDGKGKGGRNEEWKKSEEKPESFSPKRGYGKGKSEKESESPQNHYSNFISTHLTHSYLDLNLNTTTQKVQTNSSERNIQPG